MQCKFVRSSQSGFALLFVLVALASVSMLCTTMLKKSKQAVIEVSAIESQVQIQAVLDTTTQLILRSIELDSSATDTLTDSWASPWSGPLIDALNVSFRVVDIERYFPVKEMFIADTDVNTELLERFRTYLKIHECINAQQVELVMLDMLDKDVSARTHFSEEYLAHVQQLRYRYRDALHILFPDDDIFVNTRLEFETLTNQINVNTTTPEVLQSFAPEFTDTEHEKYLTLQKRGFKKLADFLHEFPYFASVQSFLTIRSRYFLITVKIKDEEYSRQRECIYDRHTKKLVFSRVL